MQSRVLIVDDDRDTRLLLDSLLSSDGHGHACELASDAASAMACLDSRRVDVCVSDVIMQGLSGLDLLDRVKQTHPALPVVLITAAGAVPHAVDAIKRGAFQYVVKPCDSNGLQRIVRDALETRRHRTKSARPSRPPSPVGGFDLVGSGPAMTALRTTIDLVARSSAPVLVTGETGTGKELVARAIHARSNRSRRPFVAVNMSAVPKELMEAEIFGHVRGAFTGAVQPRKGLFTEADGGTLLLDEIGDMSFLLQAKASSMNYGPVISRSHIEERPIGARPIRSIIYGRRLSSCGFFSPAQFARWAANGSTM
ncbi:MAG: sigma 54-interacting transcriptional regulator [Polyangiaceae bacterium]|jgi:DNA-binding NtrC family response regulator